MMLQTWKSKLQIGSFSVLMMALLLQTPPARAQESAFDFRSNHAFGGRSGRILGTVYLNRGAEPAAQISVNIRSLSSGVTQTVLTDVGGHFELYEVPPGSYEISAQEQSGGLVSTIAQVDLFPVQVTLYVGANSSAAPPRGENRYTVSVRQLKIPSKAHNEYERGLNLMAKKDFAGSLVHFNKAAAAYPDYYEAVYSIGLVELRLGHDDQAIESFQKAIDLSGGHYARPQFAYGLVLCDRGNAQEGERLIRRGLEADADAAEGHLFLGIALLDQNRLEEAEKSLREALLRNPQYADVYLMLADVHAKKRDYSTEIEDLDTYLKLAPSTPRKDRVRKAIEAARLAESSPQN